MKKKLPILLCLIPRFKQLCTLGVVSVLALLPICFRQKLYWHYILVLILSILILMIGFLVGYFKDRNLMNKISQNLSFNFNCNGILYMDLFTLQNYLNYDKLLNSNSYLWWLYKYGYGKINKIDIFGMNTKNGVRYDVPNDVINMYSYFRRNYNFTPNMIPVCEYNNDIYYMDTQKEYSNGEYPVIKFSNKEIYAKSFKQFLFKFAEESSN